MVSGNDPILVGEQGPEIFTPAGAGRVLSNADSMRALGGGPEVVVPAPQVNVSVVNVTDPNEISAALDSPEGEKVVLNIMRKNRRQVRSAISI